MGLRILSQVCVLACLFLKLVAGCSILSPPESDVVGFVGQKVSLTCTVCPDPLSVFWILDGADSITLRDGPLQARKEYLSVTDEGVSSQLTFTATPERNHTVACKVYGPDYSTEESDIVTVLVQGVLSAPNVNVTSGIISVSALIHLEWDPPPSLIRVSQYTITLVTFNTTQTIVLTNQTEYVYAYNQSECEVYNFSIRADNPAGPGDYVHISVSFCDHDNVSTEGGFSTELESSPTLRPQNATVVESLDLVIYVCTPAGIVIIGLALTIVIGVACMYHKRVMPPVPVKENKEDSLKCLTNRVYGEKVVSMEWNDAYSPVQCMEPPHIYETIPADTDHIYETV